MKKLFSPQRYFFHKRKFIPNFDYSGLCHNKLFNRKNYQIARIAYAKPMCSSSNSSGPTIFFHQRKCIRNFDYSRHCHNKLFKIKNYQTARVVYAKPMCMVCSSNSSGSVVTVLVEAGGGNATAVCSSNSSRPMVAT